MLKQLGNVTLEPHTVSLKDEGHWWGYKLENEVVSVLCIRKYHNNNWYLSENFTKQEHRKKGYFTKLLSEVMKHYDGVFEAHALISSVRVYLSMDFEMANIRRYKNGDQYIMIKE